MKRLFVFLLLFCSTPAFAGVLTIDSARLPPAGSWTKNVAGGVGVVGGIPSRLTNIIDVTQAPYNADKTGATDAHDAIQAAITAVATNGVVYLPAGTYRLDSRFVIYKTSFTIRGDGDSTILDCRMGDQVFYVGANSENATPVAISGSPAKGDSSFTVADASTFSIGDLAQTRIGMDTSLPTIHVSGANASVRAQTVRITNKVGNVLTFSPALYFALPSGLSPTCKRLPVGMVDFGMEDLKMDGTNGHPTDMVLLNQAYNCWFKNITSYMSGGYHLDVSYAVNCEFRHCHINNSVTHVANGSGIRLNMVSATLVEDNIIERVGPSTEENIGTNGNVFAYNLGIRGGYGDPTTMASVNFDCNHGPHTSYSLYEGNVGEIFQSDGYTGSSSEMTVFRNWFRGYCPDSTDNWHCVALGRFSRNFNVVGNILGQTGYTWVLDETTNGFDYSVHVIYQLGYPNMGNSSYSGTANTVSHANDWADWGTAPGPGGYQELDLDVFATTLFKGNYDYSTAGIPSSGRLTQAMGSDTLADSLYLASKPAFFGSMAWPAIDPTTVASHTPVVTDIPAGYRYINGGETPGLGEADTNPPTPNPATIASNSHTSSSVTAVATAAADETALGSAPYYFRLYASNGSTLLANSGWQAGTTGTFSGLSPSTTYKVTVQYEDAVPNAGTESAQSSIVTDAATIAPARARRGSGAGFLP